MTGRYHHLTQAVSVYPEEAIGYHRLDESSSIAPMHLRALLFMLFALAVGAGLLAIVPDLSASGTRAGPQPADDEATLVQETAAQSDLTDDEIPVAEIRAAATPPELPDTGAISPIFTAEVQHWAPKIAEWSAQYGLDANIIATIMQIESCGDPGAASYAGAQGLFQVMPFHFAPGEDMLDPDTNALRGMTFYNRQLEYTGQDIYLSFAGYNGGYAASGSSYPYWANETQRYFTWAKGIYDEASAGRADSPTLQSWLAAGGSSLCHQAAQRLGL